jgi:peroxiredoxin
MVRIAFAAAVALCLALSVQAGKFNKVLSVGDAAPTFANLPGVDDKNHSLDELKDKDVVVVVFTCNHCPVAKDYEDRLVAFAKPYSSADSKVAVVAICPNDLDDDRLPKMKERAKEKNFSFWYLYDESGATAKAYGATKTPEFFVLNKERKVVYMGAMDDNIDPAKVKTKYLEDAVKAALAGEKVATAETEARGCSIKFKK